MKKYFNSCWTSFYFVYKLFIGCSLSIIVLTSGKCKKKITEVTWRDAYISVNFPSGFQNQYRLFFDPTNGANNGCERNVFVMYGILDLIDLLDNSDGTTCRNDCFTEQRGKGCWYGTLTIKSSSTTEERNFNFGSSNISSNIGWSNAGAYIRIRVPVEINSTITITLNEPCLLSQCRRNTQFPRLIWDGQISVPSGTSTFGTSNSPGRIVLAEKNISIVGLCN